MKHLVIKNLGPLKEVDIELDDLNVIIGAQSTGKSCVLKMACYCSWVEKRIMLTQALDFYSGKQFINDFVSYYFLSVQRAHFSATIPSRISASTSFTI